ncbi:MAG: S8 family serine peptidase [Actinomycetota bacterium]|nr:S8 family serine peptidase [Actinomycetota bacterium]
MSPHRVLRRLLTGALAGGVLAAATLTGAPAAAGASVAPLSASLVRQLTSVTGAVLPVLVHGATLTDAQHAVAATGMGTVTTFRKVGVVVATGTPSQIAEARTEPGVTYLEGNQRIAFSTTTSHQATRGAEATQTLLGADGRSLDGSGVTVAVIDSGIDPNHPAFAGGKVVRNLKSLCLDEAGTDTACVVDVPAFVDTDTLAVGGHGTHVNGIAAGNPVTLADGSQVSGAAPGAKIVSISTGAVLFIIGAQAGLNWVLDNHANPCAGCPPIKVVNNSYGPAADAPYEPESVTVKIQEQLAREGVVTVWAAGNSGGDGSATTTNPPGHDQMPGIISVASYNDLDNGTRDGQLSEFSSRGSATDPNTWPDLSAPGENIASACRPYLLICSTGLKPQSGPGFLDVGSYNTISGTSMAAPHITGIVAQLFQAAPNATPAQIEEALKATAHRFPGGEPYQDVRGHLTSFDKGAGLVDVVEAARALGATVR